MKFKLTLCEMFLSNWIFGRKMDFWHTVHVVNDGRLHSIRLANLLSRKFPNSRNEKTQRFNWKSRNLPNYRDFPSIWRDFFLKENKYGCNSMKTHENSQVRLRSKTGFAGLSKLLKKRHFDSKLSIVKTCQLFSYLKNVGT